MTIEIVDLPINSMVIFHSLPGIQRGALRYPGSFTPAPLRRERPQADHRDTGLSWGKDNIVGYHEKYHEYHESHSYLIS